MPRKPKSAAPEPTWEDILKSVTVEPSREEILFDPYVLDTLTACNSAGYIQSLLEDARLEDEKRRQIEQVREIAARKLKGRHRECLLLLLSGCDSYSEIGEKLGFSRDTVRRALEEAAKIIKAHLEQPSSLLLPAEKGERLKSTVLPIDTLGEQKDFQRFLNSNKVHHLAYSSGITREVFLVYE
jgi:DNA-binding CsgD family transcriptional regulator